jgi:hypothetical protein
VLSTTAHAAADAPSVRHSLRPLNQRAERAGQASREKRGEIAKLCPTSLRGAKRRSNPFFLSLLGEMDCFASLAMTVLGPLLLFEIRIRKSAG